MKLKAVEFEMDGLITKLQALQTALEGREDVITGQAAVTFGWSRGIAEVPGFSELFQPLRAASMAKYNQIIAAIVAELADYGIEIELPEEVAAAIAALPPEPETVPNGSEIVEVAA
jgi:hypothetical protein